MATTKFTVKLLVDNKAKRVLFAEADKEVVDFLFGLLSLPLGSVLKLLTRNKMLGCIGNLYDSVDNLNETYVFSSQNKEFLLNPKSVFPVLNVPPLMPDVASASRKYYRCSNHMSYVTDVQGTMCPSCNYNSMSTEVKFVGSSSNTNNLVVPTEKGGFVVGVVTYMIVDDLVVSPMSAISCITLLNKFGVDNVGSLEEKVVDFGMEEGLELLKTSLESQMVLTNVFLGKKGTDAGFVSDSISIEVSAHLD